MGGVPLEGSTEFPGWWGPRETARGGAAEEQAYCGKTKQWIGDHRLTLGMYPLQKCRIEGPAGALSMERGVEFKGRMKTAGV